MTRHIIVLDRATVLSWIARANLSGNVFRTIFQRSPLFHEIALFSRNCSSRFRFVTKTKTLGENNNCRPTLILFLNSSSYSSFSCSSSLFSLIRSNPTEHLSLANLRNETAFPSPRDRAPFSNRLIDKLTSNYPSSFITYIFIFVCVCVCMCIIYEKRRE